jgi:hypothetical protein
LAGRSMVSTAAQASSRAFGQNSRRRKGTTVTANVVFAGANTIKVRYALVYRDGKLVNEIWQIDPNLRY